MLCYHSYRFTINSASGEIRTVQPLDYETQIQHVLDVQALDSAPDSRSTTIKVTVNVNDMPDSVPIFTQTIYEVSVPEEMTGAVVTTVEVCFVINFNIYRNCH